MKRAIFTITLIYLSLIACAQISNLSIVAEKIYDDNLKTVYLKFEGSIPSSLIPFIEEDISNESSVKLFVFYDKSDLSQCMITCHADYAINDVMVKINNCLIGVFETANAFDLPGTTYENELKRVKYRVEFSSEFVSKDVMLEALRKTSGVILTNISEDGVFEMILNKNTPWYEVDRIIRENGAKQIIPIF